MKLVVVVGCSEFYEPFKYFLGEKIIQFFKNLIAQANVNPSNANAGCYCTHNIQTVMCD
jgi:hypothetical protein